LDSSPLIVYGREDLIEEIVKCLIDNDVDISEIYSRPYSLEDYFLELIHPKMKEVL